MKKSLQRTIRAHLRDLRVLFQESRNALLFFGAVVLSGALIFHFFSSLDVLRRLHEFNGAAR